MKYYYDFKKYKTFSAIFSKSDIKLLKSLGCDKSIIITKPDKGKGVVTINKTYYLNSMKNLMSDVTKFKKINDSYQKFTLRIEDKINRFLLKLKNQKIFNDDLYFKLKASGSSPGILYGLPKIHKIDFASKFQFRPIFAAYNTPSYNIAKYLVSILSSLTTNEYSLKNSFKFKSDI